MQFNFVIIYLYIFIYLFICLLLIFYTFAMQDGIMLHQSHLSHVKCMHDIWQCSISFLKAWYFERDPTFICSQMIFQNNISASFNFFFFLKKTLWSWLVIIRNNSCNKNTIAIIISIIIITSKIPLSKKNFPFMQR